MPMRVFLRGGGGGGGGAKKEEVYLKCILNCSDHFDGLMQECSIFSALATDMYSSLALSHRFDITASLFSSLQWRHNEHDGLTNHQRLDGLFIHLSRLISKKTSTLRVADLCKGNSPVTSEFPAEGASNTDFFSFWWHHHALNNQSVFQVTDC